MLSGRCPACQVDENGSPQYSEMDAIEYLLISRSIYLNVEQSKGKAVTVTEKANQCNDKTSFLSHLYITMLNDSTLKH